MKNLIVTLWTNLEKWQKIAAIILIQGIVIIVFVIIFNSFMGEKSHIEAVDETNQTSDIPEEAKARYEDALWKAISNSTDNLNKNIIKDAVIREGSYTESYNGDTGTTNVRFIVDIDSIKQTYVVYTGWSTDRSSYPNPIIDCPSFDEIKYPDNIAKCKGTYRDASSLSLYLPYRKTVPEGKEARNIFIDWDEDIKTIYVQLVVCNDPESLKKEATDYLNKIPTDLSKYKIEYNATSLDGNCIGGP